MDSEPRPVNRGWFFPIVIVNLLKKGTINEAEFVLLGLINELCNPKCWATNAYLAERWGKTRNWTSITIRKFEDLGLMRSKIVEKGNVRMRYLWVTFTGDQVGDSTHQGVVREITTGRLEKSPYGSSNKEVTNSRCADDAPGERDSFGLTERSFTIADELAQMFSDWTVKNKLHVGRAGSYMNGWTKRTMGNWARSCRQLLTQEESKEVRRVLAWYIRHWKDEYVPQCYSMRKFCERFVDIQRRMRKIEGEDAPKKKTLAGVAIVNGKRIEYFDREEA